MQTLVKPKKVPHQVVCTVNGKTTSYPQATSTQVDMYQATQGGGKPTSTYEGTR